MMNSIFLKEIEKLQNEKVSFCIATLVDGRGSIPQILGAKAIFTKAGLLYGTVGGGKIEALCQQKAITLLKQADAISNSLQKWNLQKDVGMTCGGEVTLYFEVYRPELDWNIMIFGAGHISQKLCRFLIEFDCSVVCIDTRMEWLGKLPESEKLQTYHVGNYSDGIDQIVENSAVILMTMGHCTDIPILKKLEEKKLNLSYLGLIGSDSKSRIVKNELGEDGLSTVFIDSITCPIGETIGNNTPPEIAFSVISQLLKQKGLMQRPRLAFSSEQHRA